MKAFVSRYSTPLITGLFLVSLISGIALFFHWESRYFHSMHEWLSMVLIAPFVMHLWKHWRSMIQYFRSRSMPLVLVLSFATALSFPLWPTSGGAEGKGRPEFALARQLAGATPSEVAPLFDLTPEELVLGLKAKGFDADAEKDLETVARHSNAPLSELYAALLQIRH